MPVKSYIAFPRVGMKEQLIEVLKKTPHCEVMPALNKDVLVLVTDTADDQEEEALRQILYGIKELAHLNLVSGYSDKINQTDEKSSEHDNE